MALIWLCWRVQRLCALGRYRSALGKFLFRTFLLESWVTLWCPFGDSCLALHMVVDQDLSNPNSVLKIMVDACLSFTNRMAVCAGLLAGEPTGGVGRCRFSSRHLVDHGDTLSRVHVEGCPQTLLEACRTYPHHEAVRTIF